MNTPKQQDPASQSYYQAPDLCPSLGAWLDRARLWHIEYGGYLSNHLTHNWVVMGAAHAPQERFQWWEDLYKNQLEDSPAREPGTLEPCRTCPPDQAVTEDNWLTCIERDRKGFAGYRDFFDGRISEIGASNTLRKYLPPLLPGLAGAALHPVIHTGWAMDAQHMPMLADGLAYMATAFQPLGTRPPQSPPAQLWSAHGQRPIEASLAFLKLALDRGFSDICDQASKTEEYLALQRGYFQHRMITFDDPKLPLGTALNEAAPLGLPAEGESLLPAIEEAVVLMSASLQASDNEFFVLHGLTSLHAVLTLLPHLEGKDQRNALAYWWRAAMAAVIVQDLPGIERSAASLQAWLDRRGEGDESPPKMTEDRRSWWRETLNSTLGSLDEHVPKAVYVHWRWSEWEVFSPDTLDLFEATARQVSKPHPEGDVGKNLRYERTFTD